jgi:SAM domain (Sterile alpha motif)
MVGAIRSLQDAPRRPRRACCIRLRPPQEWPRASGSLGLDRLLGLDDHPLCLERCEAAFRDNVIDETVLPDLTDQDLEKLGVLLGHRRKLQRAIAELKGALEPSTGVAAPVTQRDIAERRQVTVMFSDLVRFYCAIGTVRLRSSLPP